MIQLQESIEIKTQQHLSGFIPIIRGEKRTSIKIIHQPSKTSSIDQSSIKIPKESKSSMESSIKTSEISLKFSKIWSMSPRFSKEHFQLQFLHSSQQLPGLHPVTGRHCRCPRWVATGATGATGPCGHSQLQGLQGLQGRGPGVASTDGPVKQEIARYKTPICRWFIPWILMVKMWEWLDPIAVLTCVDDLLMLIGYLLDDLLMVSCTPYHAF